MTDLSPEARALIEAARPAERPAPSAKGRVRAALAAQLSAPPGAPHAASEPPASHVGPSFAAGTGAGVGAGTKLVLLCALTTAALVGGAAGVRHWASRRAPEPARSFQALPPSTGQPLPVAAASVALPALDRSLHESRAGARPVRGQPRRAEAAVEHSPSERTHRSTMVPVASSAADSRATEMNVVPERPSLPTTVGAEQGSARAEVAWLPAKSGGEPAPLPTEVRRGKTGCSAKEELRLLDAAQIALRERRPKAALAMLDQHTALCPAPRFREEHSTAHILALCLLHQSERAQAEAAQLAAVAPNSPQLARLRTSCAAAGLEKAAPDRSTP
jgi:hypothetical protein